MLVHHHGCTHARALRCARTPTGNALYLAGMRTRASSPFFIVR